MTAKWVAELISGRGGERIGSIYGEWIKLRGYTWLSPNVEHEFRDGGGVARNWLARKQRGVVRVKEGMTVRELESIVEEEDFRGYPVVIDWRGLEDGQEEEEVLLGYVIRRKLEAALRTFSFFFQISPLSFNVKFLF